jgi:hypothetical protein
MQRDPCMRFNDKRFIIKFWLFAGTLLAGSVGCLSIAANAQSSAFDKTKIVSVSETMQQLEKKPGVRQGVMTERLRRGETIERIRQESWVVAEESP